MQNNILLYIQIVSHIDIVLMKLMIIFANAHTKMILNLHIEQISLFYKYRKFYSKVHNILEYIQ